MEFNTIHPKYLTSSKNQSYHSQNMLNSNARKDPKTIGGMFEAMFYRMIFNQMRQAQLSEPLFDTPQQRQFQQMQDDELAYTLGGQGHLGIVKMITDYAERMAKAQTTEPAPTAPGNPQGLLKPALRRQGNDQ